MMRTLSVMYRHALRTVRAAGMPFFVSVLMCAMGLFGLAVFATFMLNVDRLTGSVSERIRAVCFLDVKGLAEAEEVEARVAALDGVKHTVLVTPEQALEKVAASLGEDGQAARDSGIVMPFIVEATPAPGAVGDGWLGRLREVPGVDEVMHPSADIERVDAFLDLVHGSGLFLAVLMGLVVLVVVSNAVRLTLFSRREEIAIMKLVGATDGFVRGPFLFEGFLQGVLGGLVALSLLYLTQEVWSQVFATALAGTLGAATFDSLPVSSALWLVLGGGLLGLCGGAISIGRFLRV